MKKMKYLLILILSLFSSVLFVNASVTRVDIGSHYTRQGGFLLPGYRATVNANGSTINSAAFCIDPARLTPSTLNIIDQVNVSDSIHDGLYRIYQKFYQYVSGDPSGSGILSYRAYYEAAIRAWYYVKGISVGLDAGTAETEKYKKCLNYIKNFSTTTDETNCFNLGQLQNIQDFYGAVNHPYIYDFKEPSVSYEVIDLGSDNVKIQFTFNIPEVFNSVNSGIILDNEGLRLSNGSINFQEFNIDGSSYFDPATYGISDYSGSQPINSGAKTTYIILNKNTLYNNTGKKTLSVGLKYVWNHPLNPHNLYIAYPNGSYQRMMVVVDYKENEFPTFNIELDPTTPTPPGGTPVTACYQDGNKFYVNGVEKTIEEYVEPSNCTCDMVNVSAITDSTIKDRYYSTSCGSSSDEEYNNTMTDCSTETSDSNKLTRDTKETINEYCDITCNETISLSNLTDIFSVQAGRTFTVSDPNLTAKKSCNVSIKSSDWQNAFYTRVLNQLKAYNIKNMVDTYSVYDSYSVGCGIGKAPAMVYKYEYYGQYDIAQYQNSHYIKYDNSTRFTGSYGGCFNSPSPKSAYPDADAEFTHANWLLTLHLRKLISCNQKLDLGTDEQFYALSNTLKFFYMQRYSNDSIGYRWNTGRPNNVNDSFLNATTTKNSANTKKDALTDKEFKHIDASGSETSTTIKVKDNNIHRSVQYDVVYTPAVKKYVDSYTGDVKTTPGGIELGNVYDVDATAVKGTYDNEYVFEAIGEKNYIYEYYKNDASKLKRTCDYEITNPWFDTTCTTNCDVTNNIIYRTVDPENIDPNGRINVTDQGMTNWKGTKGDVVKESIQDADTYHPDNLEYSFTLNSKTIKQIREYNENNKYSDFKLNCNSDGNECISDFLDDAETVGGYLDDFTNLRDGKASWKYIDYNSTEGYHIAVFNKNAANYNSLIENIKDGGENFLP